jgi:hypothetical protein
MKSFVFLFVFWISDDVLGGALVELRRSSEGGSGEALGEDHKGLCGSFGTALVELLRGAEGALRSSEGAMKGIRRSSEGASKEL